MIGIFFTAALLLLQSANTGLDGRWEGAISAGPAKLRVVLDISKASDGIYLGTLTSVDQGNVKIPIDQIQMTGDSVRLEVRSVRGIFEGTINSDKTQLKGTWTQGGPTIPLEFARTAAAAAPAKPPDTPGAATPPPNPFGLPLELKVPVAPTPLATGGKTHLVYELHITNFGGLEMLLSKLEILGGDRTLASYEGAELNSILQPPGLPGSADRRAIPPGMRTIAFLWIAIDAGSPLRFGTGSPPEIRCSKAP